MKTFKEFLAESNKVFNYRIKTLTPITQIHRDSLERLLDKYKPVSFVEQKTMLQKSPMDFANVVESGEVYIIDVALQIPVSAYLLRQEIRNSWGVQEDYVLVKAENDVQDVYDQQLDLKAEIDAEAEEKGLKPTSKLGTSSFYPEYEWTPDGKKFYGNEHNQQFLETLAQVASDRKENRVEPHSTLFNYLDYPKVGVERENFNQDIPGAPMPVSKWTFKYKKVDEIENVARMGNFDNEPVEVKKEFQDAKGKKRVITRKNKSLRQTLED